MNPYIISNIFYVLLFLSIKTTAYSQTDTIFYDDGGYKIINKINLKDLKETDKNKIHFTEFSEYTSSGSLTGERKIFGKHHRLTQLWTENGNKYFEEYINKPQELEYQIIWDTLGFKESQIIANNNYKVLIKFYKNNSNSFKEFNQIKLNQYDFDSISVFDEKLNILWVEQRTGDIGKLTQQIEYYENGKIKSEKNYQTKTFFGFSSKEDYSIFLETGNKSKISKIIDKVKSGVWKQFSPKGNLEQEIEYNILKNPIKVLRSSIKDI